MPSDDGTPGAREANVIGFIERVLTTVYAERRPFIEAGLADLNRRAGALVRLAPAPSGRTHSCTRSRQTPFFEAVRFLTIVGMFSDPSWGGNREQAGWKLLGFDARAIWQPPFGAYDANAGANE